MNKKILIVGGLLLLVVAVGWFLSRDNISEDAADTTRPKVAATIFPVYDIARSVAGDHVDVELIVEPGQSPHTFDATPGAIRRLQGASHVFAIGHELDDWVVDLARAAEINTVVTVDHGIALRDAQEHEDHQEKGDHDEHDRDATHNDHADEHEADEHGHHHGDTDPHYWLDPMNAALMAEHIAEVLSTEFPEHEDAFSQNAEAFASAVDQKNEEWEQAFDALDATPRIVTMHDAFGYFAEHFGIDIAASIEPFPGKEPTPQYLAELQGLIEETNVSAVFLEPQLSRDALAAFVEDTGVSLGTLDPLGGIEGKSTYIDLIDANVQAILNTVQ